MKDGKMLSDALWEQAHRLAAKDYYTVFERETLSDGTMVFIARNPQLPGCKAQGNSPDEAARNLAEARVDYIYALLDEGLTVPAPVVQQSTQGRLGADNKPSNITTETFSFGQENAVELDDNSDPAAEREDTGFIFGISLGGDLVKDS
jgi:predicted RNase H-like HicB family nuclease